MSITRIICNKCGFALAWCECRRGVRNKKKDLILEIEKILNKKSITLEGILLVLAEKDDNFGANIAGHVIKLGETVDDDELLFFWRGGLSANLEDQYKIVVETIYQLLTKEKEFENE